MLADTTDINQVNVTDNIKKYLKYLKRNETVITNNKRSVIPIRYCIDRYKKEKELTTTSPPRRHLGYHYTPLVPNRNNYENTTDFSESMCCKHIIK